MWLCSTTCVLIQDLEDTIRIYVKNHCNECREFFIWIRFDQRKLGEKGSLPLLLEDPLISETWDTHPADETGCEALSSKVNHRNPQEIHKKSSEINDLENEPGHVWRLPKVSRVTMDDI